MRNIAGITPNGNSSSTVAAKKKKAKIAAGTPREWFHETAVDCRYLYDIVKPDDELGPDYLNANIELAEKQILKAGYRLARCAQRVVRIETRPRTLPPLH